MPWRVDEAVQADQTVHVWPDYETGHLTEPWAAPCWCDPVAAEQGTGRAVLVSHRDRLERLGLDATAVTPAPPPTIQ